MKMFHILVFALCSCAHHSAKTPKDSPHVLDLIDRYHSWMLELSATADQETMWPSAEDCDATLWAGEAVMAGFPSRLGLAEYAPGEIHRRPARSGECYPEGSASTVSNDMLMGYLLGTYHGGDKAALMRLENYGESHHWAMGVPATDSRVLFSPSGQGLLARAAASLGAPKKDYAAIPETCLPVAKDYEYHDQTLSIYLNGVVSGSVSDLCLLALKHNAKTRGDDALIQSVYGIYSGDEGEALGLLLGDYACPTYVRPEPAYCLVHKLMAASIVLKQFGVIQ